MQNEYLAATSRKDQSPKLTSHELLLADADISNGR